MAHCSSAPPFSCRGFNAVHNETGFVELVEGAVNRNRFAVDAIGPQLFYPRAPVVVLNQGVGRAQNVAGRTVVLFQTDGLRAGEIVEEALDVLHLRAAPAVDRLVVIAYDHHLAGIPGQQADPGRTGCCWYPRNSSTEDVGKAFTVVLQDMRFVQPQLVGTQQQFGEIHQTGAIARFLIGLVDVLPVCSTGLPKL